MKREGLMAVAAGAFLLMSALFAGAQLPQSPQNPPPGGQPPSIGVSLSAPQGGESWAIGSTHAIRWTFTAPQGFNAIAENVIIELLSPVAFEHRKSFLFPVAHAQLPIHSPPPVQNQNQDPTTTVTFIARVSLAQGSYSWTIPQDMRAGSYRIRVKLASNPATASISPNFSVVSDGGTPPENIRDPEDLPNCSLPDGPLLLLSGSSPAGSVSWFAACNPAEPFCVISAVPSAGASFSSWSGACSGAGPCAFQITGETPLNAIFRIPQPPPASTLPPGTSQLPREQEPSPPDPLEEQPIEEQPNNQPPRPQGILAINAPVNSAGIRAIKANEAAALVDLFSEGVDVLLGIKYSGTEPATNVSLSGLQAPFSYAGGAYPGTGGTCGGTITADCTIVLNFKPGQPTAAGVMTKNVTFATYRNTISLSYNDGSGTKTDGPVTLGGYSQIPGDITIDIRSVRGYELGNFGSLITNRTTKRALIISNPGSAVGTQNYTASVRNVSVSLPSGPFTFGTNTCGTTVTPGYDVCTIDVQFSPISDSSYRGPVTVSYDAGISNRKTVSLDLIGEGFVPDPSKHLLLVYNSLSPESTDIKNYYIANRPGMSGVNVLPISFDGNYDERGCFNQGLVRDGVRIDYAQWYTQNPNCENIGRAHFESKIRQPIIDWILSHPEKDIRHIILVYMADWIEPATGNGSVPYGLNLALMRTGRRTGVSFPTVIGGVNYTSENFGYFTQARYPGTMALPTYLWMGSVEATKAYIDKLKDMWNRMPVKSIVISTEGTGKQGSRYYFEDTNSLGGITGREPFNGIERRDAVHAVNPNAPVLVTGRDDPYITLATDVVGYMSWGTNGGHSWHYANDGSVRFSGNSGWYSIMTYESFNGKWDSHQGDFTDWFSANAFGGTNYSNTPVGAVGHVDEPSGVGVNSSAYFQCWEKRHLFIDCAWVSSRTGFQTVIGDPWVTK